MIKKSSIKNTSNTDKNKTNNPNLNKENNRALSPEEEEKRAELKKEIKKKKHFKFFWVNIVIGVVMVFLLLVILVYLAPGHEGVEPFSPSENPRLIFEEKNNNLELSINKFDTNHISK